MAGEAPLDSLVDDGHRIVAVQGFQMSAGHLKIENARIRIKHLVEQTGGVLHEFGVVAVDFGEGLFVLAQDHCLGLGQQGAVAHGLQFLDGKGLARTNLNAEPRFAALRVGDGILPTRLGGVLGQVGGTGTGGAVDKVKMQDFAEAPQIIQHSLVGDFVILITFQAAAQALLDQRVAEMNLEAGAARAYALLVRHEDFLKQFRREDPVLEFVEHPHDPGHIDALAVGRKRHSAGDGSLQHQRLALGGHEPQRQAEIGNADLRDRNIGPEDFGGVAVLRVGEGLTVFWTHN